MIAWLVGAAVAAPSTLGRELFLRTWVVQDPRAGGDGLGPRFNEASCVACHAQGGVGGAGDSQADVLLTVSSTVPARTVVVHRVGDAPPSGVVVRRNTTALFGAGLVDRIDDAALLAAAAEQEEPVSGRVSRTADGAIGRFGWKADVSSLDAFVAKACAVELGLETVATADTRADLDPGTVRLLTAYVAALPRPVQVEVPGAERGREVFGAVGCAACHRERLGDVDGLYADLLLHDLGRGLADLRGGSGGYYYAQPTAEGMPIATEWRTPPLWGLRDSAPYLHDGRAATVAQAIAAHGGEASASVERHAALSAADREALEAFLVSLSAP